MVDGGVDGEVEHRSWWCSEVMDPVGDVGQEAPGTIL
jgi:hypothetical protein